MATMSGKNLLRSIKEALAQNGEDFKVQRGASSHSVRGMRSSPKSEIWFAGDTDIQVDDALISAANGDEFIVTALRPEVLMNVQVRVFAGTETFAAYKARLAAQDEERVAKAKRAAEAEFDSVRGVTLDERQQALLEQMVEATHKISNGDREPFIFPSIDQADILMHAGLPEGHIEIVPADLRVLTREGLFDADQRENQTNYMITPRGSLYYRYMMTRRGAPVERLTSVMHRYLDADEFRQRYPDAYTKWSRAESELWAADSDQGVTAVGHLCREAMQEFADTLVKQHNPPNTSQSPGEKPRTKNRVRAVVLATSSIRAHAAHL
jgi:hypothetical protein